jgi:hypothetical protein
MECKKVVNLLEQAGRAVVSDDLPQVKSLFLMKNKIHYSFLLCFCFLSSLLGFAQAPQSIPYQAVVRNADGSAMSSTAMTMTFKIHDVTATGNVVYQESHTTTSNAQGLVILQVGQGQAAVGTFDNINWGSGAKFLHVMMNAGAGEVDLGTQQMMSVPYALYALTAGNLQNCIDPEVLTVSVTQVDYHSVLFTGSLVNNGNKPLVAKGYCISTNPNPTEENGIVIQGYAQGNFTATISNLQANTQYFVRAFASNTCSVGYGDVVSFTTLAYSTPQVQFNSISNITANSAVAKGYIQNDGGQTLSASGFCIASTSNPTISDLVFSDFGSDSLNAILLNLNANQTYHIRSFASNTVGTGYSSDATFTTLALPIPLLVTNVVSSISYSTAHVQAQITNLYGYNVTSKGVCIGTQTNPTISNTVFNNNSVGLDLSVDLSVLTPGTVYFVRSFVNYGSGVAYGNQLTLTTLAASAPSLTTVAISAVGSTTANSGGTIVSDGGSAITNKGICWSTSANPTISNSFVSAGSGVSSFNSVLSGLTVNTLYYVRSFAVNATGTAYGNQLTFTTTGSPVPIPGVPTVGTVSIVKTVSSYVGGGYISYDGGSAITQQGICWNTTGTPTITDNIVADDSTGQGFFSTIVNIPNTCNITYYIRAFAINATGIAYGNQVTVGSGLVSSFDVPILVSNNGTSATISSNILTDGGCSVTQRGICWSITSNPTLVLPSSAANPFKLVSGSGIGTFEAVMNNLVPNTTYYVRTYATTSTGTYFSSQVSFTSAGTSGLAIGQTYGGGVIFYLDNSGQHGLICAPSDLPGKPWGCPGPCYSLPTTFGSGAQNTAAIISLCSQQNTAALACDQYSINGYADWYLPSYEELKLIWQNLYLNNVNASLSSGNYWCSSDYGADGGCGRAWSYNFGCACVNFWYGKETTIPSRPVRSF